MNFLIILPVLFPIIAGTCLFFAKNRGGKAFQAIGMATTLLTSVTVFLLIFLSPNTSFTAVKFSESLSISFKLDTLAMFFSGMVSFLWPFALWYSFVYLKNDKRKYGYFAFYIISFGTVLGISLAQNALTLYIFYEILTFVTLPLIMYPQNKEARAAGRYYLYYSLSGSSLALAGIVTVTVLFGTNTFTSGGFVNTSSSLLLISYLLMFFGFGVKAAVLPGHAWLPEASVAPTPTTALLHAVAVVKSGAFAIIRVTYQIYSPEMLRGTFARDLALCAAGLTVIYGSAKAIKEQHFKRRFAYSTVANLSYILVGALLCTGAGLEASLLHFVIHSVTKIGIFFCIGAVAETAGTHFLFEINGFARKMPFIFGFFTLSGLSLIGVPLFGGFVSKFYLVSAGLNDGSPFAIFGVSAIILSAIFTTFYVLSVCFRAYVRTPNEKYALLCENAKEPEREYLIICGVFAVVAVLTGIFASPLCDMISSVAGGIL